MDNPLYTIHARALGSESMLNAEERRLLEETTARLVRLPEKEWESRGGVRLTLPDPVYKFNLGPSLRVFLRPTPDGRPEVLDLVDQATLDWFKSLDKKTKRKRPRRTGSRS
jgi:hypothetical protein